MGGKSDYQQGRVQITNSRWTPLEGLNPPTSLPTTPTRIPPSTNTGLQPNTPRALTKTSQSNNTEISRQTKPGWKSKSNTTLSRMGVGSSSRWTKTADKVLEALPAKPPSPFPRSDLDRVDETKVVIPSYGSIAGRPRLPISSTLPGVPTPSMTALGHCLRSIPRGDLLHSDFVNNMSSEGISVVVALLLERTDTTTWSETFTHNVAHTLLTVAPETLRGYYQKEDKMDEFVRSLDNGIEKLPIFEEDYLCPLVVPEVIKNKTLRLRCNAEDLTREECNGLLAPFLRRFYPYSAIRALKALSSTAIPDLVLCVQEPGFLARLWRGTIHECVFDPPRWVTLDKEPHHSSSIAAISQTMDIPSDDEFTSEFDGFTPIKLLGLPQDEAEGLPLDELRAKTLQSLPSILSQLLSTEEAAQFVVSFATSPLDELRRLLSTDGFRSKLNNIRGLPDPPPTTRRVYRIRIHVLDMIRQWGSYDELIHFWGTAISTFLSALGFPIYLHRDPYDLAEAPLLLPADPTPTLLDYASHTGSTIKTCDIWCSTPFIQWEELLAPTSSLGLPADTYAESLARTGIRTDCRESFTLGLHPLVAFIGSDRRDRSILMIDECMSCLSRYESDLPPFEIEWLSVGGYKRKKHVMVKCVMATMEHRSRVTELFRRMEQMTTSSDTRLITKSMSLLFFPLANAQAGDKEEILGRIWDAQDEYDRSHTRVIITDVPAIDPFSTPLPCPASGNTGVTPSSIAHNALMGGVLNDDGESFDTPIVKITTDTAFTQYYLYAHVDDAQDLIRRGQSFLRLLTSRLHLATPLRLCTAEARKFIPTFPRTNPSPQTNIKPPPTDGSVAASLDSKVMTLLHSMNQTITEMGHEITNIKEQLRPTTIAEDVISAVQSSITTTAKELHNATHTSTEDFIHHLMQHVKSYSWDIGTICHELNSSHAYSRNVLQDLVDRYDATAIGSYDGTMAFGNELVMLRLAVTACAERINLLIADQPNIPRVPLGDDAPMSPNTATRAMDAIHDDYDSGIDLTSMVTVTEDPSQLNALTQDTLSVTLPLLPIITGPHTSDRPPPLSSQPFLPVPTHNLTHAPTNSPAVSGRPNSLTNSDTTQPTLASESNTPSAQTPSISMAESGRLTPRTNSNTTTPTTAPESDAPAPTSKQASRPTSVLQGLASGDATPDGAAMPSAATTETPLRDSSPTAKANAVSDPSQHSRHDSGASSALEDALPFSSSPDTSDYDESPNAKSSSMGTMTPDVRETHLRCQPPHNLTHAPAPKMAVSGRPTSTTNKTDKLTRTLTLASNNPPPQTAQASLSTSVPRGLARGDTAPDGNTPSPAATTETPTRIPSTTTNAVKPSISEAALPISSSPDTSDTGKSLVIQTPRSRSRSVSSVDSGDSEYSVHTAKSTSRSRRRRHRRRSYSPKATTSSHLTSTPRSRSTQSTLHQFINKERPRRTNTKY